VFFDRIRVCAEFSVVTKNVGGPRKNSPVNGSTNPVEVTDGPDFGIVSSWTGLGHLVLDNVL